MFGAREGKKQANGRVTDEFIDWNMCVPFIGYVSFLYLLSYLHGFRCLSSMKKIRGSSKHMVGTVMTHRCQYLIRNSLLNACVSDFRACLLALSNLLTQSSHSTAGPWDGASRAICVVLSD